jgi:PilZ domain
MEKGTARLQFDMTQSESGPEQRRWSRHKIDVRLKASCKLDGKPITTFGRANTLSQGGMGAYIPCSLAIGTSLLLELTFPYSSVEVKINALIRSCEGFRYGLEFVDLRDELRMIIVTNCNASPLLQ